MGWFRETDAEHQARYDRMKAGQNKSEDRRQSLNAMHRGMSGHPASETKKTGWTDMSDRQLAAHGMVRVRGFFGGVTYRRMEAHHDIMTGQSEQKAIAYREKKERQHDERQARKGQKKPLFYWGTPKSKPKKKGFFSW